MQHLASKVRPSLVATEITESEAQGIVERGGEVLRMKLKVRVLDPPILLRGKTQEIVGTKRLSEVDVEYGMKLKEYLESKTGKRVFEIWDE